MAIWGLSSEGLTINGVATIYILICVGLAVDYSAHIAHAFMTAPGKAPDRAMAALGNIGPSVFHAVFSTLLAVIVLAFSKSYVFLVFFKTLFLVTTLAGAHGLLLLVLLGLVGGDGEPTKDGAHAANGSQVADVVG